MVTEQEQKTEELEEKVNEETGELASNETEPVSEKEGVSDGAITFTSQDELDKFIQEKVKPAAQGMKDKELKPVYDELQRLKKDKVSLERRLVDKQEDTKLAKLESAELGEYGDTIQVKDFQEARREIIELGRKNREESKEIEETASRLQRVERQQNAFEKALKLFLPEDEEFLSTIEGFAKKLQEAETEREMNLIYEMEESRIRAKAEAPKKPKRESRPDSGLPTAAGGVDTKDMSPDEKLAYGFKQLKRK